MPNAAAFETSVFINCPFDADYDAMLQAMLFCIVYLGLRPRLARERNDSGEYRLEKIKELIVGSKYSIHDLSRCQATRKGEHYRLNMPFELGIDYGCREYYGGDHSQKRILILEEKRFRYQAAISDLSDCDIEVHGGSFENAIRKIRNWLASEGAVTNPPGGAKIRDAYYDFQEWYFGKQEAAGFSAEDILDYSTPELLAAMSEWIDRGKPL